MNILLITINNKINFINSGITKGGRGNPLNLPPFVTPRLLKLFEVGFAKGCETLAEVTYNCI